MRVGPPLGASSAPALRLTSSAARMTVSFTANLRSELDFMKQPNISFPQAGKSWMRLEAIDMHSGGEPLRVFVSGLPPLEGNTVLEKRRYFRDHYDYIRTGTIWEPRGHADMYGAVLTPSSQADFDVFFLHNEGYSTMCGLAFIALTTLAVETGLSPL